MKSYRKYSLQGLIDKNLQETVKYLESIVTGKRPKRVRWLQLSRGCYLKKNNIYEDDRPFWVIWVTKYLKLNGNVNTYHLVSKVLNFTRSLGPQP